MQPELFFYRESVDAINPVTPNAVEIVRLVGVYSWDWSCIDAWYEFDLIVVDEVDDHATC